MTTLKELYDQRPPERHGEIVVAGDKVYVTETDGTDEYVLRGDGELVLIRSDRRAPLARIRDDVAAIRRAMGV